MQQEKRTRGDAVPHSDGTLPDRSVLERQPITNPPGPLPLVGSVSGVPSEQLWRAAVLAAREAALTAAELRRSLEAHRGGR
jgi:hypothetical protein